MKPIFRLEVIFVLCLYALPLGADVVFLKNGEEVQGQVVSEDEKEVKVVVTKKGMSLSMAIRREDIARVETGDGLRAEYGRRFDQVSAVAAGWERATKFLELGRWARESGLFDEARAAFAAAKACLPGYDDVADLEIARTWLAEKEFEKCRNAIQKILERNPNHEQAKLLARDLGEDVAEETSNDLEKALTLYCDGNPRRALAVFENFVKSHSAEELSLASKGSEEKTGEPLASLMIDCRFRQGCPEPGCITGWKRCPRPTCKSGVQKDYHKVVEGWNDRVINHPVTSRYCETCNGMKYLMCGKCRGTGIYLGKPTDYEREEMVRILAMQSQKFLDSAMSLVEETKDKDAELSVRGLNCMNMLADARRARYLLQMAAMLAPSINAPGGQDAQGKIRGLDALVFNVIGGIASAYLSGAEIAYHEAVNQKSGADGEQRSLSSRVVRAREALEFAEQARVFILYALEDSPGSVVPMGGDLKDRLRLADQFVARCRATYQRLSELEKKGARISDNDLVKILQEMAGGFTPGTKSR